MSFWTGADNPAASEPPLQSCINYWDFMYQLLDFMYQLLDFMYQLLTFMYQLLEFMYQLLTFMCQLLDFMYQLSNSSHVSTLGAGADNPVASASKLSRSVFPLFPVIFNRKMPFFRAF